jgi:hypothetical protein
MAKSAGPPRWERIVIECPDNDHVWGRDNRLGPANARKTEARQTDAKTCKWDSTTEAGTQRRRQAARIRHPEGNRAPDQGCTGSGSLWCSGCYGDPGYLSAWTQGIGTCRATVGPGRLRPPSVACAMEEEWHSERASALRRRAAGVAGRSGASTLQAAMCL